MTTIDHSASNGTRTKIEQAEGNLEQAKRAAVAAEKAAEKAGDRYAEASRARTTAKAELDAKDADLTAARGQVDAARTALRKEQGAL